MYTVENKTYHSFKELVREYNRRECMAGMKLTKEFVDAYKVCRDAEKAKQNG